MEFIKSNLVIFIVAFVVMVIRCLYIDFKYIKLKVEYDFDLKELQCRRENEGKGKVIMKINHDKDNKKGIIDWVCIPNDKPSSPKKTKLD